MNIHTNVGISAIIISAVDALAPAGIHLEITVLAHIISFKDNRHLPAWQCGTRHLHQQ
jgi:hypothetical protein